MEFKYRGSIVLNMINYFYCVSVFAATNPCLSDHDCQHVCFKGKNNQPTCACFANFELESDEKKCKGKSAHCLH